MQGWEGVEGSDGEGVRAGAHTGRGPGPAQGRGQRVGVGRVADDGVRDIVSGTELGQAFRSMGVAVETHDGTTEVHGVGLRGLRMPTDVVDVWMQHPTLRHSQHEMFDSLRRWMGADTPTEELPLELTLGVGEAATVGSTPAVQNAVIDALAHLGVRHIDMPCTPERVWQTIVDAEAGTLPDPWREPPAVFDALAAGQEADEEGVAAAESI